MMSRIFDAGFKEKLLTNKIIWLEGPIGSGKSLYASQMLQEAGISFETIDFRLKEVRNKFNSLSLNELVWYFNQMDFYILKDAQYLKDLQQLIDAVLTQQIGASLVLTTAFKPGMNEELKEAITWEGLSYYFSPKSYYEWTIENGMVYEEKNLENRLVFGNLFSRFEDDKSIYALDLTNRLENILSHQLGAFERINKKKSLHKLLQLLALKVGESVSYNELGELVDLDNETVERYIDLFQAAHLLIVLPTLYNENRYEVKKQHVVYFIDNGIRNALIQNFSALEDRFDQEILWKNWLIAERYKWLRISQKTPNFFFWKSHTRQFIDLIEIEDNEVFAMRCSWNKKKKIKEPPLFAGYYPQVIFKSVNRTTYLGFLTKK
jgi:predicted AAA+ superfamily ATPase